MARAGRTRPVLQGLVQYLLLLPWYQDPGFCQLVDGKHHIDDPWSRNEWPYHSLKSSGSFHAKRFDELLVLVCVPKGAAIFASFNVDERERWLQANMHSPCA